MYDWDRYWDAVTATPDVEVWGALREQRLLAYLVAVPVEGWAEFLIARSADDGLRHYPNNALLFTVARDLLRRSDIERILFGARVGGIRRRRGRLQGKHGLRAQADPAADRLPSPG